MTSTRTRRFLIAAVGVTALTLPMAACSPGDEDTDGKVEISFLVGSSESDYAAGEAMVAAFEEENPDISVTLESQPDGTEGDNLIKTKLSTGEMQDVFWYNSGSLLKALNPDQNLVDLSDQEWTGDLQDAMKAAVSTDNGTYGAPFGTTFGGGVLYNKPIYEELGLQVPTSWDEFAANNDAIVAAGKTAVIQTYADSWTSQLFVLVDFGNVLAQDPDWADQYTAGNRKYADDPGLQGFTNLVEASDSGWLNEDFASASYDDGIRMIATGEGAHYPGLSNTVSNIEQNFPENIDDVGIFALPAQDAADTTLTAWFPDAVYIPKTTQGDRLEAAKAFVAFINSPAGCEVQNTALVASGPYATSTCELPDDVPSLLQDLQSYYDDGASEPALEFLSPIKGPNLENIMVEVGSGIRAAEDGAKLYDNDVKKQAQQLGLEGW